MEKEKPKEIVALEKIMGASSNTLSGHSRAILELIESQPEEKHLPMLKLVITDYYLVPDNSERITEQKMDENKLLELTYQMIDEIIEFKKQVIYSGKSEDEVAGMLMENLKRKATLDERVDFLSHILSADNSFVPYIPFKIERTPFTSDEIDRVISQSNTLKRKAVLIHMVITNPFFQRSNKGSEIIAAVTQIIDSETEAANRQILVTAVFSALIKELSISSEMPGLMGLRIMMEALSASEQKVKEDSGTSPLRPGFFARGKGGRKDH